MSHPQDDEILWKIVGVVHDHGDNDCDGDLNRFEECSILESHMS